ncbi:MAG: isoprenylcysteine carboxylmethyltransferase family protein [Candidatus Omnitrophica bacterium]|nr:isoprenylcysteine carboxylmethyltransferase family protein [Candidatus Omnitrophota bacterium]MCK5287447.1 isoprenylcysteine carboxylmethyltransferase family protein [Candidatus Omnitrophota bacterium]MCK5494283.1 isoprenylcysteine carboxylmethyltransferase family protein [Candidatus Omnitrophota bacterium]
MMKRIISVILRKDIYCAFLVCYGCVLIPFTAFFVFIGIKLDDFLGLPKLIPKPYNLILFILFFLLGLGIVLWAYSYLAIEGKGSFSPYFGKTKQLVKTGPYSIVRHPSIIGKLFGVISLGFLFQSYSFVFIIVPILLIGSLMEKVLREEKLLEKIWGIEYIKYKKSIPMIIPRFR